MYEDYENADTGAVGLGLGKTVLTAHPALRDTDAVANLFSSKAVVRILPPCLSFLTGKTALQVKKDI